MWRKEKEGHQFQARISSISVSTYPISLISLEIKASCHSADARMPPLTSDTPLYRHFLHQTDKSCFCHLPLSSAHPFAMSRTRKLLLTSEKELSAKPPYLWWIVCVCLRETHKVIWPNHIQTKAYIKSALLDFTGHQHAVMDELSLWRQNINILPTADWKHCYILYTILDFPVMK